MRDAFYSLLPSWLTTGEGELVVYSLTVIMDATLERLRQGVLARFPEYAPADALQFLARDRRIILGRSESAARLITWLDAHKVRGTPYALHDQLRAYCGVDLMVRTVDARGNWYTTAANGTRTAVIDEGNWEWDSVAASSWSRFWVIIYSNAGPWTIAGTWGDAVLWGAGVWGTPGATWGTSATSDDVAAVRAIVRDWKPAGTTCEWIVIAFDPASFDPAAPEPSGGDFVNWHKDSAGTSVPARLSTARYWRGSEAV
jgi:hypothetical protein